MTGEIVLHCIMLPLCFHSLCSWFFHLWGVLPSQVDLLKPMLGPGATAWGHGHCMPQCLKTMFVFIAVVDAWLLMQRCPRSASATTRSVRSWSLLSGSGWSSTMHWRWSTTGAFRQALPTCAQPPTWRMSASSSSAGSMSTRVSLALGWDVWGGGASVLRGCGALHHI